MEAVTDFLFLGSKITADGDCSHEIKRCLLLERKTLTNLDSILKSKDSFSLRSVSRQRYFLSPILFIIVLKILASKVKYKIIQTEKEEIELCL